MRFLSVLYLSIISSINVFCQADLTFIGDITINSTQPIHVGNSVNFSFSVKNIGNTTINKTTTGIYISTTQTATESSLISELSFESLAQNDSSKNILANINLPYNKISSSGPYYLIIKLNKNQSQIESNYSNNSISKIISLDVAAWAAQNTPYPIILVHGLIGNDSSWYELIDSLRNQYGWSYGGNMNFSLNFDSDITTSNKLTDYHDFTNESDLQISDFYTVNFDVDFTGVPYAYSYLNQSNQSAVVKQGLAISDAISHVLNKTGRDKVILVGHSMGGLAAREYIQNKSIWYEPFLSHHVAKLVTIGTPHGGSNANDLGILSTFRLDLNSEAVRDLRTSYFISQNDGVYLFGGKESKFYTQDRLVNFFHNVDVNCNGTSGETIVGLNEKFIPLDLSYSCLIGTGVSLPINGDGIVTEYSANLNNFKQVNANVFELPANIGWHLNLTKQFSAIMRGLDEANDNLYNERAYHVEAGKYYYGNTTLQSNSGSVKDFDYYSFTIQNSSNLNLNVFNITTPIFAVEIKNSIGTTVFSTLSNGKSHININTQLLSGVYTMIFSGVPTLESYKYPYSFRIESIINTNSCQGTTVLSSPSGTLSDGSNDNDYSNNLDCIWKIEPGGATSISVSFIQFNCDSPGDTLFLYDGSSITSPLLGAFTGSALPPYITTTGGIILLRFKTNSDRTSSGWLLNYAATLLPTVCNGITVLTAESDSFSDGSGLGFYANNSHCSWIISPPNAQSITLSFQSFITEPLTDLVNVYEGTNNSGIILGSFSGSNLPNSITSSTGAVFVEFITNGSDTLDGWVANYTSTSPVSSSSIIEYEYWFDNFLQATTISVVPQTNFRLNGNISTQGLPHGLHTFNIRFKKVNNLWSSVITNFFYKQNTSFPLGENRYQYWFDNDFQNVVDSLISISGNTEINDVFALNNISNGLHTFNFRFKQDGKNWSSVVNSFFYRHPFTSSLITEYQYWFNNNFSSAVNQTFAGTNNYILLNDLNTTSLSFGLNSLNFRFKNTNGIWSSVSNDFIYKPKPSRNPQNKITTYRYWFDTLSNNITTVNLSSPVSDLLLIENICASGINTGAHEIHFQFLDSTLLWSSVISSSFTKTAVSNPVITVTGSTTLCQGGSVTLTSSPGTSYLWNTGATTQSIIVNTAGNYFVLVNNGNGCSLSSDTVIITTTTAPVQPGLISGNNQVCQGSSQTYSIAAIPGASSYTWILPSGWTGSSTTNSIDVTAGNSGGNILVRANNTCGSSPDRSLAVTVNTVLGQPGPISGNTAVCQGSLQSYSVASVTGATGYNWTLPAGWTGSSTTNTITVTAGSTNGNILVSATNLCGSSPGQSLTVTANSIPDSPGSISGSSSVCQGSTQTYSITAVSGATSYTWTLPAGWLGVSTTNSISVTAGSSGGNILVRANNLCGSSIDQTLSVNVTTAPGQPGAITGSNTVCQGTSQSYSIAPVSGAINYTWTLPAGWVGASTTNNISVTAGATGGLILVKANNSCGSSIEQSLSITVISSPAQPGPINGLSDVCQASVQTYSVSAVSGATSYIWTLPTGWVGSSNTNSISVTAGNNGGNILVKAVNNCGSSPDQSLSVTVKSIPTQPGSISGSNAVCPGSSQSYSVGIVPGATGYTWTLPAGWSGSSNTNSITTTTGSSGGNIVVKASNGCGNSPDQVLTVSMLSSPGQPGSITGSTSVCQGVPQTYSVAAVAGATGYNWTLPAGWSGTSNTNIITVTPGSTGGNLLVKTINSCGVSTDQSLNIAVALIPAQPGPITGNITATTGQNTDYSITPVSGATNYNWILLAGGSIQSGQNTTGISVNWTVTGTHILSVNASNSCGNSINRDLSINVSPTTGIINPNNEFQLQVMPNPTDGIFYLKGIGLINKMVHIEIMNSTGQLISTLTERAFTNTYIKTLDLTAVASGVYFLKIRINKTVYLRIITKQ